jgi:hypothetical protein
VDYLYKAKEGEKLGTPVEPTNLIFLDTAREETYADLLRFLDPAMIHSGSDVHRFYGPYSKYFEVSMRYPDPYTKSSEDVASSPPSGRYSKGFVVVADASVVYAAPPHSPMGLVYEGRANSLVARAAGVPNSELKNPAVCEPEHRSDILKLYERIRFLEAQLQRDTRFPLQLYKLGGASLIVGAISLIVWAATGIGVPFHPVFAATVIPVSIGVMVMAFLLKREIDGQKP